MSEGHSSVAQPWYRPMIGRRPDEEHRASTPLELLFDLCFVVAVGQAGAAFEEQAEAGHVGHGVLGYVMVFFAIWWAWMNFTWFASAYDTDDVPYRVTVLVQIAGSLVMAAGIQRALEDDNFTVLTWAYVVMRLAMVTQWLRAARADPEHRGTAIRYAIGITVVQLGWILRLLFVPDSWGVAPFFVLVVLELAVPAYSERRNVTTFHPHHIAERYGEFTVIVLGEAVTAAALSVKAGLDEGHGASLIVLALMGLIILFAMWWLYFDQPERDRLNRLNSALFWGYGHYFVFAGIAAVGAGLSLSVAYDTQAEDAEEAHELSSMTAAASLAVPVAIFLLATWVLQIGAARERVMYWAIPVAAVLVLATMFTHAPVHITAAIMAALVVVMLLTTRGTPLPRGRRG